MDGLKSGRIEKRAGVHAVSSEEISPFFPAESHSESTAHGAKASIRGRKAPSRLRDSKPGSRRHLDHQAGLVSIFRRRTARNGLQGLNRVQRNLVGENFTLRIREWL